MPASDVDWSWPLLVLTGGLLLGLAFAWRQLGARRRATSASASAIPPVELRDLFGKRDALIAQLRELEDTGAKLPPAQLALERDALELGAARVLRELERHPAARSQSRTDAAEGGSARASSPAELAPAGHSALRGFLWGVGSVGALGLLLFLVNRSARPREEGKPVTGEAGLTPEAEGQKAAADPEEARLRAELERNPEDVEARIALAQVYLGRSDMMGVWNETKHVLDRHPGHPRASSYQALVRLAMGQPEVALEMLTQVVKADPDLIDAYIHLALVYRRLGRTRESEGAMAEALRRFPRHAQMLAKVFAEMRERVQADESAPGEENPHTSLEAAGPGPEPPAPARTPEAGAAAPSGRRIAGTIELDPALRGQVAGVLFLIVREARLQKGPPAAVQRMDVSAFPVRFEISDADSMAGEPLPDPARLEARLDADGNAMTRDPGDPIAVQDFVRAGSSDLKLVLKR